MIRTVLFALLCAALVGLAPPVRAAGQHDNLLLVQWPGPPDPYWPGPAPGPEWLAHQQQCEALQRHLAHLRHRIHRSPPWVRQELAEQAVATRDRLRAECWGP